MDADYDTMFPYRAGARDMPDRREDAEMGGGIIGEDGEEEMIEELPGGVAGLRLEHGGVSVKIPESKKLCSSSSLSDGS